MGSLVSNWTNIPNCNLFDSFRSSAGVYAPECDAQGFYKATQCHNSVGVCWCVDKHGVEFANTRTRAKPNCGTYCVRQGSRPSICINYSNKCYPILLSTDEVLQNAASMSSGEEFVARSTDGHGSSSSSGAANSRKTGNNIINNNNTADPANDDDNEDDDDNNDDDANGDNDSGDGGDNNNGQANEDGDGGAIAMNSNINDDEDGDGGDDDSHEGSADNNLLAF